MRKKRQQSDDEVEAEVRSKLRDASAWEVFPFVSAAGSPRPAWASRSRLAVEAARLDRAEEQWLAEEGYSGEADWPAS